MADGADSANAADVRLELSDRDLLGHASGRLGRAISARGDADRPGAALCGRGARLILGEVTGLDREGQQLQFADRPPLPYDALSIGIGSVPSREGLEAADDTLLPIKPMQTLLARLAERLQGGVGLHHAKKSDLRISIVGGGVGGVEVAFCLPATIKKLRPQASLTLTLIDSNDRLVSGTTEKTASRVQHELVRGGVQVHVGRRVTGALSEAASHSTLARFSMQTLSSGLLLPRRRLWWANSACPPTTAVFC